MFKEYKARMTKNSVKLIFITTLTSALITVAGFVGPLLVKRFVENYTADMVIWIPVLQIVGVYLVCYLFKVLLNKLVYNYSVSFKTRETCELLRYMFRMKYEKLISLEPTYLVDKITNSVNTFYTLYSQSISSYIISTFSVVGSVVLMFVVDKGVAVILVLLIPVQILGYKLLNKKLQNMCITLQTVCAKNFTGILSVTSAVDYIKQCENSEKVIDFLSGKVRAIHKENARVGNFAGFVSLTLSDFVSIVNNLAYIYVTILMLTGYFGLADYIFMTLILSIYFPAVNNIVGAGINLRDIKGVYQFVEKEIMDNIEENGSLELTHIDEIAYDIHNVGYGDNVLIEDGAFSVKKGEVLMVRGESGCGKTTLMKALVRFLNINSIFINGVDIRQYRNESVRGKISFFSQNVPIITGTIRENILFGQKDTKFDLSTLRGKSFMEKFFAQEDGLDHMILENGSNLSGGDKQKIALARLYIENPDVIILDEITSSIDRESADMIFEDILEHFGDRIILVIAHDTEVGKFSTSKVMIENKHLTQMS